MNLLTDCIREDGEYRQLLGTLRKGFKDKPLPLLANGLCDGAADALTVCLIEDTCTPASPDGGKQQDGQRRCALVICSEEKECLRLCGTLERFGLKAAFYTHRDLSFYNVTASHEYEHERLKVLSGLLSGGFDAVVTTPDAALGYTVPPERLRKATIHLDFHVEVDPTELSHRLVAAGYSRVDMVEGAGQFAIRGGIVDVCAPYGCYLDDEGVLHDGSCPLRIELFDREIDRMGLFDPDTQRMTTAIDQADLLPAREIMTDRDTLETLNGILQEQKKSPAVKNHEGALDTVNGELAALTAALESGHVTGQELHFLDKYIKVIYPECASLLNYFPDRSVLVIRSGGAVQERLRGGERLMAETVTALIENGTVAGKYAEYAQPITAFELFTERQAAVYVDSLSYGMGSRRWGDLFGFRTKQTVSYAENFSLLCEDLTGYMRGHYRLVVMTENEAAARNLRDMLEEAKFDAILPDADRPLTVKDIPPEVIVIIHREHLLGFELVTPKIALLSTNPDSRTGSLSTAAIRGKRTGTKKKNTRSILSFNDLEVGDIVVHETYGIGRYMGIETLTTAGVSRDYISIHYAGTDKLYIPVEKLDMVSKYIGSQADDGIVKLSHLGTDHWNKTKARTKAMVKEMAKDLIRLYAERARHPGYAFPADDDFQRDFDAAFEYEETDGQIAAIIDVKADMQKPTPMDRLICGDVGYGKTEVAIRAAFKAVTSGKQVAVLVPTTILALQHFQTFSRRMRNFSVNVDMISRFKTPKEQEVTLRRLERGDVDVIIGTHKLLGRDIRFRDLGLLIVDEEQRFGVAQKEKLKQLCGNIDVLTLTATPIPRTLNMAMGGIRDISVLDEAPVNRLPVQTYVLEHDDLIINEAIHRELRRGGQVFYLHNTVETINDVAAKLSHAIPDARITVAHGKMHKEDLELIWEQMLAGQIDILVCTTIIETGVDVPNANTLIVDRADRLGLSQLHQIRGRVGRSARRAYAYFTYRPDKSMNEVARKRLEAIREYTEFGAGFRIALRDMEIRGAGNILGSEQHGHMEAVGYDLYIKLLNQAVLEEQGKAPEPDPECTVSLDYSAHLPASYIRYPAQRMALYKRIALIRNTDDRDDMIDELIDRYGDLPEAADNLLTIALIRAEAIACGIQSIRQDGHLVYFMQQEPDIDVWMDLCTMTNNRLTMVPGRETAIRLRLKEGENAPKIIHKIFEKYLALRDAEG